MQSEDARQVIEALNYIGRNVAQQDEMRARSTRAMESLASAAAIAAFMLALIFTALVALAVK